MSSALHRSITLFALLLSAQVGYAFDGSEDVFLTVTSGDTTGWKTFEIITGESESDAGSLGGLALEGFTWNGSYNNWDGLGAYKFDSDTLRVFVNHETGSGSFSRVDLNIPNLKAWIVSGIANNTNSNQVLPANPVLEGVSLGWAAVDASAAPPIDRPCSANVWEADTFGPGLGFADDVHILGEESSGGLIHFTDLSTRTLYAAADLGGGKWENATPINTGRTDTIALVLSEDIASSATGNAPLYLYVGEKDDTGGFLERNGLVGGTIYYWDPVGASTNGTMSGIFSAGAGAVVSGTWTTVEADAALFSKSEDVHTNINKDSDGYGLEVALACQSEGIFIVDLSELDFVQGDLGVNRDSEITVLFEADPTNFVDQTVGFNGMDNLVWSANGNIYVNEDDGDGDIWMIDGAGSATRILDAETNDPVINDDVEESSGIIDVSAYLDYTPGSVFLTTGLSNNTVRNQIAMAVAPDATLLADLYGNWVAEYPALDTPAKQLKTADPDFDGLSNEVEFALELAPDTAEPDSPLIVERGVSETNVRFTPGRSLNYTEYFIEYTDDLDLGFINSVAVTAAHIDGSGEATVVLPTGDELFVRLNVVLP